MDWEKIYKKKGDFNFFYIKMGVYHICVMKNVRRVTKTS